MTQQTLSLTLPNEAATERLGRALAGVVAPGDCVLLDGQIGAGKTYLARALIQSLLPQPEDVPSPTFTLVQVYDTTAGELWHCDLYRLGTLDEMEELGLTEAFETAICLIEWPDRLGPLTPPGALVLHLSGDGADPGARVATFRWSDPRWTARLKALLPELSA